MVVSPCLNWNFLDMKIENNQKHIIPSQARKVREKRCCGEKNNHTIHLQVEAVVMVMVESGSCSSDKLFI
jgi:hypothetical protein